MNMFEIICSIVFLILAIVGIVGTKLYRKMRIAEDMKDSFKDKEFDTPSVPTEEDSSLMLEDMAEQMFSEEDYKDDDESDDEYIQY